MAWQSILMSLLGNMGSGKDEEEQQKGPSSNLINREASFPGKDRETALRDLWESYRRQSILRGENPVDYGTWQRSLFGSDEPEIEAGTGRMSDPGGGQGGGFDWAGLVSNIASRRSGSSSPRPRYPRRIL